MISPHRIPTLATLSNEYTHHAEEIARVAAEQHVSLRFHVLWVAQTREGVIDDLDQGVLATDLLRFSDVKDKEKTGEGYVLM